MSSDEADLVVFLRARLDDDEAYARNAFGDHNDAGPDWREPSSGLLDVGDGDVIVTNDSQVSRCMERFDPARVLAEVDRDRRIIEVCAESLSVYEESGFATTMLRLLALPHADHPDYRQKWRP
jgi:hypothetical protein